MCDIDSRGHKRTRSPEPWLDSAIWINAPSFGQPQLSGHLAVDPAERTKRRRVSVLGSSNGSTSPGARRTIHAHADLTSLPVEILQEICLNVDPISLGRLMTLSRFFGSLLDPEGTMPTTVRSDQPQRLPVRKPNIIWTLSRRKYCHGMPRPMDGLNELESWKLALGRTCQFCGKPSKRASAQATSDLWHNGPGRDGVRTIWPFRMRSCAQCLESRTIKVSIPCFTGLVSAECVFVGCGRSHIPIFSTAIRTTIRFLYPRNGLCLRYESTEKDTTSDFRIGEVFFQASI
jgi:hypothetical protein